MGIRSQIFIVLLLLCGINVYAQKKDSLHYPLTDRRGDRYTWQSHNPFNLQDTSIIKQTIEYDPVKKQYIIVEKIGNTIYRTPTVLSQEEFYRIQARQAEIDYFNQRAQTLSLLNRNIQRPKPRMYNKLFDRIFGVGPNGLKVDIKPQGSVDLNLGYQGQKINNPTLPERARNNGGLDFNMNSNVNVLGSIGDKLKLPISYNTGANFNFENQLKLDYKGMDDEILKSVEAGNITFQTKSTLIPSVNSLFGLKTQMQFGKLTITAAIANQNSQKQSVTLAGGGLSQTINKKMDDYDENRNFLLAQYFRKNYNKAMKNLPVVNSQVQIMRLEVWVTNRTGIVTNTSPVVALADLGENVPSNSNNHAIGTNELPDNGSNDLYSFATANRNATTINTVLQARGLNPVNDYEKTFARKLDPSEYYYNPKVGFLCLRQQLQPSDVLSVAYQYTYNGKVYQVGEFSQDVTVDSTKGLQKVLFLKMLKATSQRTALPIWGLMMKNIYTLDVTSFTNDGFNVNIVYQQPSGGIKRYLPESSPSVAGQSLLTILNLDRLNARNDPSPDGLFDYVDSFTVLSQQGKIIFPLLEPFGRDLDSLAFANMPQAVRSKYVYRQLYDSIKIIAQTYANLDHFMVQGKVKGASNSEVYLGGFNIPRGSVTVNAGGQVLQENADYIIDYNLGTLKVINQAIVNSGVPVNVQFENNASYGTQQRSFIGLRADYAVNKKLSIGTTMERLAERPYFTKEDYGQDPIKNTIYGFDVNYQSTLPGLTKLLNKLPFYSSTAQSSITAYGEAAILKPGHASQIGKGNSGVVYIDDFEGSSSNVDLRFPFVSWALASTPAGNGLFPEASLQNNLQSGKNRAKLAWYNIEPTLQDKTNTNNPLRGNLNELSDPRVRAVSTTELFPKVTTNITDVLTTTFDLAYYPTEPGPYNYSAGTGDITADGKLTKPQQRWGGIMRSIDQTDFETGNVEFVEFWVQDPFIKNPASTGGKLYLNLGSVSEDILKDGRRFYENGLTTPTQTLPVDSTGIWGNTPLNPIQITQAFSNTASDRSYQDVGFDGLDNNGERSKRANDYLAVLSNNFGQASQVYQNANNDPSHDDYKWYRDASYDATKTGILGRYKNYNNPQGNSPVATSNSQFSPASTLYPDNEDLDKDNTLNETESYYEYAIDLKPGMDVGTSKYITDKRVITPRLANGTSTQENWYLFRVPVKEFTANIGNIPDFKSIRFLRMYLTGFQDSVTMRFASLNLVRNQWRTFTYQLDTVGAYSPIPTNTNTSFDVLSVNIEQNSSRTPIPYKIPPGIERVQILSNNGVNLLQNEQSMSLRVHNLEKGDARAVFKSVNLDLRKYGQMSMFVHAESIIGQHAVADSDLYAIVRIGQDYLTNYYEVRIPLAVTLPNTSATAAQIWPTVNNLDFSLNDLVQLKIRRNANAGYSLSKIYREVVGNKTYSVMGNPNLGEVQGFLVAIQNARKDNNYLLNAEVWVDELRLSDIDETGGWSALGKINMQLADLGTLSVSANMYTYGFGSLEQSVNQRAMNDMTQFDIATNIDAGKLLPKKAGITIPVYASIDKTVFTPRYDPYDQDVLYKYKLSKAGAKRDSVRNAAVDQTTIKTLNFTNVRFGQTGKRPKLWSISNFDFSYSVTSYLQTSPTITRNSLVTQRGGFGYTYSGNPKFVQPFKKAIKSKSQWYSLAKDFNFNLTPSLISFRTDINRQTGLYIPRVVNVYGDSVQKADSSYNNFFTFDRYYNLKWDLSRSLNLDFNATNNATVDQPFGLLNTKAKRDTVRRNFFKGGRNTMYQQRGSLSYNLPLSKFPLTDWITATYSYTTTYNWIGASLLAVNLGNTIENSQQNNFQGRFDFAKLYGKSKFLQALSSPPPPDEPDNAGPDQNNPNDTINKIKTREEVIKGLKGKAKRTALRKWRRQKRAARKAKQEASGPIHISAPVRAAGQLLTMVKSVQVNYSENYNSRVPGYKDSTKLLGQNFSSMQPGLAYVFGKQPDSNWLNQKAREGAITRDTTFNLFFQQSTDQHFSFAAQLEPVKEFTVDLNIEKTFSKQYTELFKDLTGSGQFSHLSPYASGGFSVSYISFNTLFGSYNPNQVSGTFKKFQNNRLIISQRLAQSNPYWQKLPASAQFNGDGTAAGYGRYAQDVLIPAFLAAYTGKSATTVALVKESNSNIKSNPFSGIGPLPNWRVTYTGLSKIPALASIFSNISLTHGYNSTLSMNSFTSALNYYDPLHLGAPAFVDTVSGNYVPFFLVPNITIQEAFEPLIGVDVTTTSQASFRFEYKKSRQLSLSLVNYQLSEVRSTGWSFGATYRKKGVNLPFKLPFTKGKKLSNDLNLSLDLSIRDDTQSNSQLDQSATYSTGGQKVITIQPNIDYVMSNRVRLKLYFDQIRTIPYISTSAPITNTRAGMQISISLAPKQ